jgi:hypothetical protein
MTQSIQHRRRCANGTSIPTRKVRRHAATAIRVWGLLALAFAGPSLALRAQGVPGNLTITSSTPAPYLANVSITTSGSVTADGTAQIRYEAGSQINLEPGFHAIAGAAMPSFDASISGPILESVAPSSGIGSTQVFTIVYSDSEGFAAIDKRQFFMNTGPTGVGSCGIQADSTGLYLINDTNTAFLPPLAGTNTISNSQCTLHGAASGVANSGTTSTITLSLVFKPGFAGPKNLYTYATDVHGNNSGIQTLGTYTVAATATADSVTPSGGTGSSQIFTAVYSDINGAGALNNLQFMVNSSLTAIPRCWIISNPTGIYLAADDTITWQGPLTTTLSNSQCTVNGAGSSVAKSSNSATFTLSIAFTSAFAGAKNIYMLAADVNGYTGLLPRGTYTVASIPTSDSVTPSSGTGSSQVFKAVYSDPGGAGALSVRQLYINSTSAGLNGVSSCLVYVDSTGVRLNNDANSSFSAPLTSTLSNSQCTLNSAGTSVVNSGNSSTVTVAISFSAAFAGPKSVYMRADDASGNSGWQLKGTYTVTAPPQTGLTPTVFIDKPAQNASVTGTVTVSGWAIENTGAIGNGIGSVKVLVDGAFVGNAVYGSPRPDVCAATAYPNRVGCPNVGYSYQLNTAALTAVSHTITVIATDTGTPPASGSSNATVTVAKPGATPAVNVDSPSSGATVSGTVTVSGWAIDNTYPIAAVQILVDTVVVGTARYGTSRADVCATSPGQVDCPNVGFTYQLNTSTLGAGPHMLTVKASDASKPAVTSSVNVPITVSTAPVPDGYIDFPAAGSTVTGIVNMSGWAINNRSVIGNPIGSVQVLVDNTVVGIANYGPPFTRQDVCNAYPNRGGCPNLGFQYSLDTSDFLPGSQHTVSIAASDTSSPPVTGVITNTVTAASGTGASHTFSFNFTDGNPVSDAQVVFNFGPALNDACAVHYVPSAQQLYLADKTGLWSYAIPFNPQTGGGSATLGDLVNTNCQIVGSGSSFQMFGNNLVLTLQVNFASSFIGPQNIYTQLSDTDGPGSYQLVGAWTAFPASANLPSAIAPSSYDKSNGLLTISLSDVNGYNYMPAAYLEFGPSQTDAYTCRVLFQRGTGPANDTLTLFAGSFDTVGEIGTSEVGLAGQVMQNSACLLDAGHSVVSVEGGNTATLVLAIQFNNPAIGAGTVYSYVGPVDRAGAGAAVPVNGAGSYANFASGSFFVQPNDFYLSSQSPSLAFQAGSSLGFSVTAGATGTFNLASLSYSCAGSTGITCAARTSGANFTVSAAAAVAGTATVTAVGGGITHLITIPVSATKPPPLPTFSVVFPSTVPPYSSISFSQIALLSLGFTPLNNWTSDVVFSVVTTSVTSGLSACIATPMGCAESLSVPAGSPVQLKLYRGLAPANNPNCATIRATGSQNGNTTSTMGTVCVNVTTNSIPPVVQLNTLTSITVPARGSVTASLSVNTQGPVGAVTVAASDTQNVSFQGGSSAVVSPTPGGAQVTYRAGNYTTILTGTGAGGVTASTAVAVTIAGHAGGVPGIASSANLPGCPVAVFGQYDIPNDGSPQTFTWCTVNDIPTNLVSCTATGGASIAISGQSSTDNSFVATLSAPIQSSIGYQNVSCNFSDYGISSNISSIFVYDGTPVITGITPSVTTGTNVLAIRGHNFGTNPSFSVGTTAGAPSIDASGFSIATVNLSLPASAAGSTLQVTVTSSGENGQGFIHDTYTNPNASSPTSAPFAVNVYDATPVIYSVVQTPALYPGGNDYVTIYGSNLGSAGTVKVCLSGTNSCGDVTATTTQPAATYGFWQSGQINALLSASQTAAPGSYDIYITVGLDGAGRSFQAAPGNQSAAQGKSAITVASPNSPVISGVSLQPFVAGQTYQDIVVTGSNFGSACPSASISGTGAGSGPQFLVYAANCTSTSVTGTVTIGDPHAPGPNATLTFTWPGLTPATYSVTIVPVQMQLTQVGATVISTDGKYTEDTTIRITAVRADTGAALTGFTGVVNVAEDQTAMYSQNGGFLSPPIGIDTGGTATFLAKSSASSPDGVRKPLDASITTTNYPIYQSKLAVPQWIISGTKIDTHAVGQVYDWVQAKTNDIFNSHTGDDVAAVLGAVVGYALTNNPAEGGDAPISHSAQTQININPYSAASRWGSALSSFSCGTSVANYFTNTLLHEARHAYQYAQASLTGNDLDLDYLPNTRYPIAPTDTMFDSTGTRTVCSDDLSSTIPDQTYKGDKGNNSADAFGVVLRALQYDALVFAQNHDH